MKGSQVGMFEVGDHVSYPVDWISVGIVKDPDTGKVISGNTKQNSPAKVTGRIVKLHKSGRHGLAEIKPDRGGKKLSRRLQLVEKVSEVEKESSC